MLIPYIFSNKATVPVQDVNNSSAPQAVKDAITEISRWLNNASRPLPAGSRVSNMTATASDVLFQGNTLPMPGDTLSLAQLRGGADIGMGVRITGQTAGVLGVEAVAATSAANRAMATIQAIEGGNSLRVVIAHMPLMVLRVTGAKIGDTVRQSETVVGGWTTTPGTTLDYQVGQVVGLNYGGQNGVCLVLPFLGPVGP